jgi:hypothetical protein
MNSFKLLALIFVLMACVQPPTPPAARAFKTLGSLEVTLDGTNESKAKFTRSGLRPQNSTPLPENAFVFSRKFSSSVDIEGSNERYISATFEVKNNSGTAVSNLSLVAYNQGGNSAGGTAIKSLINFGGTDITDPTVAQSIFPVQSVKRSGTELVADSENADFQGFTSAEADSVATSARTTGAIRNGDTPLEYGFVARNGYSRTIGDGETGLVTLTLRFAKPSSALNTPYRFVMTFVLTEDSLTRVTRGLNESTTEAEIRAYYNGASELMLIGYDGDTSSNANLQTNRLENARIGLEPTYLVTPSLLMRDVQPSSVKNDTNNTVLIRGMKFDASTSFFIQSTKLEVQGLTEREARVVIPKGFLPSKYGIMAANNTGGRAILYPALDIQAGVPARELDVFDYPNSFIEGYVVDYVTKQPIEGAKVSLPGLETQTTGDGYYLLRGVPPGNHSVKIEKREQQYDPETDQTEWIELYETVYRNANVPTDPNGTITLKLATLEPKSSQAQIVDTNGGTVYAQDGAFLKIPRGALSQPVPIQFTHLRAAITLPELTRDGNYLAFAHLSPTGLVFKKPATLFLPLQKGVELPLNTPINILYFNTVQNSWVDDITNGKISRINGRYYLEYEINHFTWIGGAWFDDPVIGCVEDPLGKGLKGISTNWGPTDAAGIFRGTATLSDVGRTLEAYAILPDGSPTTVSVFEYSGNGGVNFGPCIVYREATPSVFPLGADVLAEGQVAPFGAPHLRPQAVDNNLEDCAFPKKQLCSTDDVPILAGQLLKVVYYDIRNFKAGKVKAESIELFFEGKKVQHHLKPQTGDVMRVYHTLPQPMKPDGIQRAISIKFKYTKDDQEQTVARTQSLKSIAQLKTANLAVNVLPDNFIPANIQTPFKTKVPQGVLWIARQRDLEPDGTIKVYAEVKAYDAYGKIITSINTKNAVYFSDNSTNNLENTENRAPFINGIATIPLKIQPANSNRSDQITRVLLNKLRVSSLQPLPDNTGASPQAIATPLELKVLPEQFSGIYTPEVAVKSPSAGAKGVGFWAGVGDWFNGTVETVQKDPIQAAWFGLGFVPYLGGAIDCGRGIVNLFTGAEVDLLASEIGCIGMSLDAIATLSLRPETLVATRGVLGTLRVVNELSRAWRGAITRLGKLLLERFINGAMTAGQLIDELIGSKFMTRVWLEGGESATRKLEDLSAEMLEGCGLPLPRAKLVMLAAPLCGADAFKFLRLMNTASDALAQGFGLIADDAVKTALRWQSKYKAKNIDPVNAIQEIENLGKAADRTLIASGVRTPWNSPIGLEYPIIPNPSNLEGTRVIHVLEHSITGNLNKTLINLNPSEMLEFIDETYDSALRGNYPVKRPAHNSSVICIDLSSNPNALSNIQFIKPHPNNQPNLDTDFGFPPTGILIVFSNFNNQNSAFPAKPSVISTYPIDFARNTRRC